MSIQEKANQCKLHIETFNNKYRKQLENILFPVILLLYPLMKVNQGLDVSDSTYSLANYLYFDRMEGVWAISTFLSNLIGSMFVRMPGGMTLLGMNLYTGLLVSAIALLTYFIIKEKLNPVLAFFGELIAIGFLWIPTGILYNYLTYFFFTLGALQLYVGITENKKLNLNLAGFFLGVNVWVRIPNLAEVALIVALWYYLWLEKAEFKTYIDKTFACFLGYVVGVAFGLLQVCSRYGITGLLEAITGLSNLQQGDDSYSIFAMVLSTAQAYIRSAKWLMLAVLGILLGIVLFAVAKEKYKTIKSFIYCMGILVLLRFYWGRGMFSFRYYEDYTSMFEWGMMLLWMAVLFDLYVLLQKQATKTGKLWAMISLVVIIITPLGSNNYTFQNLNNLFIVTPVLLEQIWTLLQKWQRKEQEKRISLFPLWAMTFVFLGMIFMQSIGFHWNFVFRDGMDGTPRDTKVSTITTAKDIYTTKENAESLEELAQYIYKEKLMGREVVFYGNCPGLSYLFQMPYGLENAWPDLDSFPIGVMEENLEEISTRKTTYKDTKETPAYENHPMIFVFRKVEPESDAAEAKLEMLQNYMLKQNYQKCFENQWFQVYR
ncbi:MAG: hypothetical protein MJ134_09815 [Lachnospiraceae bacterium]|nr:hypothetical protein [Lachnospiraceae bacterium]